MFLITLEITYQRKPLAKNTTSRHSTTMTILLVTTLKLVGMTETFAGDSRSTLGMSLTVTMKSACITLRLVCLPQITTLTT
jgi:hypothetical protein